MFQGQMFAPLWKACLVRSAAQTQLTYQVQVAAMLWDWYEAHPVYNNTKLASTPHRARMHSLARLNTATWQGMIMQLTCPTKCCEAWYLCVRSPSRVRPSARAQPRRRRTPRRARPVGGCDEPADRPGRRPNTTPWLGRGCCYPGCKYILFIGCHIMTD